MVEITILYIQQHARLLYDCIEFLEYDEGECVQCMHIGSHDDESATITSMRDCTKQNGYELDITDDRYHHEIYLSNPRKCDVAKLKTVV